MSVVFIYALFFTVNTNLTYIPKGRSPLMFSLIRPENNGFNQLEEFLNEEIEFDNRIYKRIETYNDIFIMNFINSKKVLTINPQALDVFIYDEDLNWFARFWYFSRRVVYQKVLFLTSREFLAFKTQGGWEKIKGGYNNFYFIKGNLQSMRDSGRYSTPFAEETEKLLTEQFGIEPLTIIKNPKGETAFTVYRF